MEYRCTGRSAKGGGGGGKLMWKTGAQRGGGGEGKFLRADGKGKKGQEKRKERENREKFFSHLPSPPSHFGYER